MNYFPLMPTPSYLSKDGLSRQSTIHIVVASTSVDAAVAVSLAGTEAYTSTGVRLTAPFDTPRRASSFHPINRSNYPYCSL